MYKLFQTKEKVKSFCIYEKQEIIRFTNKKVEISGKNIIEINSKAKNIYFFKKDKLYFLLDTDNSRLFLDQNFNKVNEFPKQASLWDELVSKNKKLALYSPDFEIDEKYNIIYNFQIIDIINSEIYYNIGKQQILGFNYLIFTGNIFSFYHKENIISNFSLMEQKYLWHFSLSSKYNYFKEADYQGEPPVEVQAEVIKFLGVYKDELWLVLNSGLLALDIKTGKETHYIKEGKMALGEPFFEDFKGYFGYDTVLDEEKGIIFNLNLHFYIEYDLNSNKNYFDSYSFKDSSQKNGLVLNYIGGYDAENIYAYEGSKNNRFAIFSRDKKGIIWSGEIPEAKDKFPAIKDLQYGAGKLYVLDHHNTLHIFEGEINRS